MSYQIDPTYNKEDIIKVMKFIREKKATYPSEIAVSCGLNKDYVITILAYLVGEEYIEPIPLLDPYTMDERLHYRKLEMFGKGTSGFYKWKRYYWVGFRKWKEHYILDELKKRKEVNNLLDETLNQKIEREKEGLDPSVSSNPTSLNLGK